MENENDDDLIELSIKSGLAAFQGLAIEIAKLRARVDRLESEREEEDGEGREYDARH